MSSRQIRRLEKLVKESKLTESDEASDSEYASKSENILEDINPKKRVNLFDLLDDEEEKEKEKEEEEEEEEKEDKKKQEKTVEQNELEIDISKQTGKGERESERAKDYHLRDNIENTDKKQSGKIVTLEEVEDDAESEDDIIFEDAQEEITPNKNSTSVSKKKKNKKKKRKQNKNKEPQEIVDILNYNSFTADDFKKTLPLFQFNYRNLDPDNEYKNLFGDLSNKVLEDTDEITSTFTSPEDLKVIKKLCRKFPSWKGKDHRSIPGSTRKLILTKIRDDWLPTRQKNITMNEIKNDDLELFQKLSMKRINPKELQLGVKYFRFVNAINEAELHSQFLISVVLTPDHESLIRLLQKNPYHVESILQVSNILVRQGDTANNSGLVERALFVFDRAMSKSFEIGSGLHRLPFESFLNRQFCLTLFKYISILTQKGLFYTALTYCKFLLSVNPKEDPYGVRFFIDFYCLKSANEVYLIELFESPLIQRYDYWITPGVIFSSSLAYMNLGYNDKATSTLKKACSIYPQLALELLDQVCSYNDPSSFVEDAKTLEEINEFHCSQSMAIANQTYLVRAKELWKTSKNIEFLSNGIIDFFKESRKLHIMMDYHDKNEIKNFPKSLLRYAILSNENSVLAKIPESFWNIYEVFEYDVLPPENAAADYLQNMVDDKVLTNTLMRESQEQFQDLLH